MLAVDWSSKQLRLVDGAVARGRVKLQHALAVDLPDGATSDAEVLGDALQAAMSKLGVSVRVAATCLDRRGVVLKLVPLAGVLEHEVPDAVRLGATRDLTIPPEDAVIDYVVLESSAGEESSALVAIARKDTLDFYQRVFDRAGIKLGGLWPGPLAQVRAFESLAETPPTAGSHEMVAVCDGDSLELALVRDRKLRNSVARPLAARETDSGGTADPNAVAQAIRRLKSSLIAQIPNLHLEAAWIARSAWEPIDEALQLALTSEFGCPSRFFQPLASLGEARVAGSFAATVGSLILAGLKPEERINFLAPKKAVVRVDRRRPLAIASVGLALLAGYYGYSQVSTQFADIQETTDGYKEKTKTLTADTKKIEAARRQASLVTSWAASERIAAK